MYAVVRTGGKQYRVAPGDILEVEKLSGDVGDTVVLDDILLVSNDGDISIGQPNVSGASITAKITGQHRGEKILVFRYRPKKRIRVRRGHRQYLTRLEIQSISGEGFEFVAAAKEKVADATEAAQEFLSETVQPTAESIAESAVGAVQGAAATAEETVSDLSASASEAISSATSAATDAVSGGDDIASAENEQAENEQAENEQAENGLADDQQLDGGQSDDEQTDREE